MSELPQLALSIRQPWAWAIIHAGKDIENRSWPTKFRGRVLIHAGKSLEEEFGECCDLIDEIYPPSSGDCFERRRRIKNVDGLRGGIVGECEIVDCVDRSSSPWFYGPYGFVLRNARALPFQPCNGKLGFFALPHEFSGHDQGHPAQDEKRK